MGLLSTYRRIWLAFGALLALGGYSHAASTPSSLSMSFTIQGACSVAVPGLLDFGVRSALTANIDTNQTITVTCAASTHYNVGIGYGAYPQAALLGRRMSNGGNSIRYQVYRNAQRTQSWGVVVGVDTLSRNGNGKAQNITVYGRVPAQTTPAGGVYTDTLAVTITY